MQLLLVRHAPAIPREGGLPDGDRPLSPRGRARFARAVAHLQQRDMGIQCLWSSPLLRARQTAELLAPLAPGEPVFSPLLARAPDAELFARLAHLADTCASAALIGHQPWLGSLLAQLVVGREEAQAGFRLGKGSFARLEGEPRPAGMRLRGLWTLRDLRA